MNDLAKIQIKIKGTHSFQRFLYDDDDVLETLCLHACKTKSRKGKKYCTLLRISII